MMALSVSVRARISSMFPFLARAGLTRRHTRWPRCPRKPSTACTERLGVQLEVMRCGQRIITWREMKWPHCPGNRSTAFRDGRGRRSAGGEQVMLTARDGRTSRRTLALATGIVHPPQEEHAISLSLSSLSLACWPGQASSWAQMRRKCEASSSTATCNGLRSRSQRRQFKRAGCQATMQIAAEREARPGLGFPVPRA